MKKSTTSIYLSTFLLTFLCFGCLPDNQQSNTKISGIPVQAIELQQSAARKQAAKDFQGCLEDSQKALSIDNNFAQAHFLKGVCQYLSGQGQEGISSVETASKIAHSKGRNDLAEKFSAVADEFKKSSSIPANTNSSPQDKPNDNPNSDYGISEQDREFLESVEKRFDDNGLILINGLGEKKGVAWRTWNTLDWQKKVSIGQSACEMVEDFDAYKNLLSSYGDSTRDISNQLAATIVLDEGGRIYCHQAWALAWKKRNTLAREKYLDDTTEMLRKSALELMPKSVN